MEILPASQADENNFNHPSNHSEDSIDTNSTSQNETSKGTDEVDSALQEYQPLLPSVQIDSKPQRKPSTFVVTPVSIIDNNVGVIQAHQVSNLCIN